MLTEKECHIGIDCVSDYLSQINKFVFPFICHF